MLRVLFTSETRIKLLAQLIFGLNKEYHLRELGRMIKANPMQVGRELKKLEKINLVRKYRRGNMNIYSLNRKNIILDEIKRIFMKTDYLGELIRKELGGKADFAFIYGSFAKGEESNSSDIDLFVIGNVDEDELINIIHKLEKKTSREINYVLWSNETFMKRASGHHLLRSIKETGLIMIIGDEDELRKSIR